MRQSFVPQETRTRGVCSVNLGVWSAGETGEKAPEETRER